MATPQQSHSSAYLGGRQRTRRGSSAFATVARYLGALALLAMAVIHLVEFAANGYSHVPTIGTLFLLNFLGGTALAVALMSPLDRLPVRGGGRLLGVLAAAGAAMAAASIVFLLISENTTLFGFRESGYRPAIVLALIAEGVALVCLAAFAASRLLSVADSRR
jgi:hypothetical protein